MASVFSVQGKLFLFLAEAQRTEMDLPITLCGGSTQIWNPDQVLQGLVKGSNLVVYLTLTMKKVYDEKPIFCENLKLRTE